VATLFLGGLLELGVEEGDSLLAVGEFVFDVHDAVGHCGDRLRLCGHSCPLLGLNRLLTGALGVELKAEAVQHLVHLVAEVRRFFLNCVFHLPLDVGG
jgi:hypothetical protein